MTRRSWLRKIGFGLAVLLVFGALAAALALVRARAWAYGVLAALAGLIVWLWRTGRLRGVLRPALAWGLSVACCVGVMDLARIDGSVSLPADIVRGGVAWVKRNEAVEATLAAPLTVATASWTPPDGFTHRTQAVGDAGMEWILPTAPNGRLIYYLHGGAYLAPLGDVYRIEAAGLSQSADGAAVALLDYRIAPDHVFPAQLDDALAGWWALREAGYAPADIIIGGDSAGGNLALALALALRDAGEALPCGVFTLSAWADLTESGPSWTENLYRDVMFGLEAGDKKTGPLIDQAYAGGAPVTDPLLSPVFADLTGFPPMLLIVGGDEVMRSDSETLHENARAAGVSSTLVIGEGMFHVYPFAGMLTPESRAAWEAMDGFFAACFGMSAEGGPAGV